MNGTVDRVSLVRSDSGGRTKLEENPPRSVGVAKGTRSTRERRLRQLRRLEAGRAERARVLAMTEHLIESDRVLVLAMYRDGMTARMIARLVGSDERSVRRRIARVVTRMLTPVFSMTSAHGRAWGPLRWEVARAVVLEGRTVREAARVAGVSLYAARRELGVVRAMAEVMELARATA